MGPFTIQIWLLFFALLTLGSDAQYRHNRDSQHIEDKVSKLDHLTKQQILMMTHTGVPKEVIAKKILHVVGNSATANRVIDGVNARAINDKQEVLKRQTAVRNKRRRQ